MKRFWIFLLILFLSVPCYADNIGNGGVFVNGRMQLGNGDFSGAVFEDDITLENDEIIDNGTDGKVCLQGGGGSNNEDICFDLETTADTVTLSTTTGVTNLDLGTLGLYIQDIESTGDLKLNPDVSGDVVLFGDTSVGDAANGKGLILKRMASEGDSILTIYGDNFENYKIEYSGDGDFYNDALASRYFIRSNDTIYINDDGTAGVKFGSNWMGSGVNPIIYEYGYITDVSDERYITYQINDTTDRYELKRQDSYILGFDVQLPLQTDNLSIEDGSSLYIYDSGNDRYLRAYVEDDSDAVISNSDGNLNLDGAANIVFDAAGQEFYYQASGTTPFAMSTRADIAQVVFATYNGNQIVIGKGTYLTKDFDHANQPNPTLIGHSDSSPDDSNQEYWSITHDKDDTVLNSGHGGYKFNIPAQSARGTMTLTGIPTADETFVINATTITAKADGSGDADHFTIGADAGETVTNIVATLAECSESANLSAWDGDGDTVVIEWGTAGTAGNSITFTESMTNTAVDGSGTLGGTYYAYNSATLVQMNENGDIDVTGEIRHLNDTDTTIDFGTDDIKFKAGGTTMIELDEDTNDKILLRDASVQIDNAGNSCLMFKDTDDSGWTECNTLNGVMSCSTDADGWCDGS